jgi:hypothetical protein
MLLRTPSRWAVGEVGVLVAVAVAHVHCTLLVYTRCLLCARACLAMTNYYASCSCSSSSSCDTRRSPRP